ncbi:hypothetical protein [Pajaroellobacter abortibovis]|uniref:Uncharacterized protein n=1 Tax=Pajaroellobacter abortibovis TaxID=1882918 RepID=A0A1L6MV91_9BACT|nr:hypothetical protein [Pajaroellobacter abortibovis]APR99416.1 hypothetical protein BCY86_01010 [Pajaroellobacter abortibovis]
MERFFQARDRWATQTHQRGAAGSHHALATTVFAQQEEWEVDALLFPQLYSLHAVNNLRATLAHEIHAHPIEHIGRRPSVLWSLRSKGARLLDPPWGK